MLQTSQRKHNKPKIVVFGSNWLVQETRIVLYVNYHINKFSRFMRFILGHPLQFSNIIVSMHAYVPKSHFWSNVKT
jgi:hypothetical protein